MREIKFRAWDVINKNMYRKETFINSEGTFFANCDPNGVNMSGVKTIRFNNQYVFAGQFTGLLDKNGKEIYEGDVLKVYKPNTYIKGNDLHEVRWHKSKSCFAYFNLRTNVFDEGRNGLITIGENQHGRWCEIIGNIYSNPELLK